jgi:hypothetical protein
LERITENGFKLRKQNFLSKTRGAFEKEPVGAGYVPQKAKILAWVIFLVFFIENGTLGLLPPNLYFIYRNVRISDILIYGLIVYSLFQVNEFRALFNSRALLIIKFLLFYLLFEFVISAISYDVNPVEYFFRLKGTWASFLVFPYLLLLKRGGHNYLFKIMLPVAVISNIFYILSAISGIAFLPGMGIATQDIPGGFQVYRVYGGTFYGEFFFLAFIYIWLTQKFRFYQLILVVLFVLPHILAFGRSAWAFFAFTIIIMLLWNTLRKRNFIVILRQILVLVVILITVIYSMSKLLPQSEYISEALGARISQGESDVKYSEGTIGTRAANIAALLELWQSGNVLTGIGMHPMWVIKAVTEQENIYAWGFSDVRWASVLTAYGIIGFGIAIIFQIYFFILSIKIIRKSDAKSIVTYFVLMVIITLMFDTFVNYSINLISISLWGLSYNLSFGVAVIVYLYEKLLKNTA